MADYVGDGSDNVFDGTEGDDFLAGTARIDLGGGDFIVIDGIGLIHAFDLPHMYPQLHSEIQL